MPNWCYTDYRIVGEKESLDKIKDMITELNGLEKPRVENGFGKLWLGCIVDYLGGNWESISCRGNIQDYNFDDNEIRLYVEIAWAESPEFRHFLEEKIPEIKVYHYSEEPDCAGYWTNDPNYPDKYFLDSCLSIESEYFSSIDEVANYLIKNGINCEPNLESVVDAISKYSEEHDDEYLQLHEIEFIDD